MIKVLLTAAGYQGAYDLTQFLKSKGYYIIGTDINGNSAAKYYCDKFYKVPPYKKIKCDVVIAGSNNDAVRLEKWKKPILNKVWVYKKLKGTVPIPNYIEKPLLKPEDGKGARGIEKTDKMAMEFLGGEQIDVDVLSYKGELLLAEPKTRDRAYGGTLIEGQIVKRPEIVKQVKKILKIIPLSYLSVFQFIGGKLLEINPRIAGAVIDHNIVDMAIKLNLGTITKNEIKKYKIPYGKRATGHFKYYYTGS